MGWNDCPTAVLPRPAVLRTYCARGISSTGIDCQEAQDALAVLSRVTGARASGSMKKRRRLCSYLRRRVREILAKYADVACSRNS